LLDIGPTADGRIPVVMEDRLISIGNWLKGNGEAIYGTNAWKHSRQWSSGTVPKLEDKEFRSEYDITMLVDNPRPGYARVDAMFTTKAGTVYAILPRWPAREIVLDDVEVPPGTEITLLDSDLKLPWRAEGRRLVIDAPDLRRSNLSFRQAYALKLPGAR
jgi:alpha-L-fucosidase